MPDQRRGNTKTGRRREVKRHRLVGTTVATLLALTACQAQQADLTPDYHSNIFESQRQAVTTKVTGLLAVSDASPLVAVDFRAIDICDTSGQQNQLSFVRGPTVQTFCQFTMARLYVLPAVTDPGVAASMGDAFMAERGLATDELFHDQTDISNLIGGKPIGIGDRVSPNVNLAIVGDVTHFADPVVVKNLPVASKLTTTVTISSTGDLSASSAQKIVASGATFFLLVLLTRQYHFEQLQ